MISVSNICSLFQQVARWAGKPLRARVLGAAFMTAAALGVGAGQAQARVCDYPALLEIMKREVHSFPNYPRANAFTRKHMTECDVRYAYKWGDAWYSPACFQNTVRLLGMPEGDMNRLLARTEQAAGLVPWTCFSAVVVDHGRYPRGLGGGFPMGPGPWDFGSMHPRRGLAPDGQRGGPHNDGLQGPFNPGPLFLLPREGQAGPGRQGPPPRGPGQQRGAPPPGGGPGGARGGPW